MTHEGRLLGSSLESTVAEFGRSIDEFEVDLLQVPTGSVGHEGFSERDDTLLDTGYRSLEHQEVVLHNTISDEATHGCDGFLGGIELSGGVGLITTLANSEYLLVEFSSVVVTVLTSTGHGEHDLGRMPSSNTGDLSETFVGFSGEFLGTPTVSDTLETFTLGDGNDIDVLVLLEDGRDVEGLLEVRLGKVDLVGNASTVHLDLHQVGLLLLQTSLPDLSVRQHSNNSTVLANSLQLSCNRASRRLGVLLGVFGERFLLRSVPVLVEATFDFVGEMFGPYGGKGSETSGSFDVTDNTDDDHGWGLDNGDGLDDLTFVHLGSGSVKITENVGHTSLVTKHGGEVDGLGLVITGERFNFTAVSGSPFPWQESGRTVSRVFPFPVRHLEVGGRVLVFRVGCS